MTTADNPEAAAGAGNAEPPRLDRYPAEQSDGREIHDAPIAADAPANSAVPDWGTPPTGGSDSPPSRTADPAYGRPSHPQLGSVDPSVGDPAAEPGPWERVPFFAGDRRKGGFGDPYEYMWRGGIEFRRRKPRTAATTAVTVVSFAIFGIAAIVIFGIFSSRANSPFGGSDVVFPGSGNDCEMVGGYGGIDCDDLFGDDTEFGDDESEDSLLDEEELEECEPGSGVAVQVEAGGEYAFC